MLFGMLFKAQVERWAPACNSSNPKIGAPGCKENKSAPQLGYNSQSKSIFLSTFWCSVTVISKFSERCSDLQGVLYNGRKTDGEDHPLLPQEVMTLMLLPRPSVQVVHTAVGAVRVSAWAKKAPECVNPSNVLLIPLCLSAPDKLHCIPLLCWATEVTLRTSAANVLFFSFAAELLGSEDGWKWRWRSPAASARR